MTDFIYKIANGTAIYRGRVLNSVKYGTELVIGDFEKPNYHDMIFTIESLEDNNTITFSKEAQAPSNTFSYSTNKGTTWTSRSADTTWTINKGDTIMIKSGSLHWANFYQDIDIRAWKFNSTKEYKVYGNILSLLYSDDFRNKTTFRTYDWTFPELFQNSEHLVDASNLVLAATTLLQQCYAAMFQNCTSLTGAPELPATTLATYCYAEMFNGCTALTKAPSLEATTLSEGCYASMFWGCTSLETAPVLPATKLASYCYHYMFCECTSLKEITCYATNRSAEGCLDNWVLDVFSQAFIDGVWVRGDFYKKDTSWTATGDSQIPASWNQHNI